MKSGGEGEYRVGPLFGLGHVDAAGGLSHEGGFTHEGTWPIGRDVRLGYFTSVTGYATEPHDVTSSLSEDGYHSNFDWSSGRPTTTESYGMKAFAGPNLAVSLLRWDDSLNSLQTRFSPGMLLDGRRTIVANWDQYYNHTQVTETSLNPRLAAMGSLQLVRSDPNGNQGMYFSLGITAAQNGDIVIPLSVGFGF